jgi:hypothetical protein
MDQAHLARRGNIAAANESGIGGGMVWGAKRPRRHQRVIGIEQTGNAVNFRGFDRFVEAHMRQDRRQTAGHKGFSRSWRTDQEEVIDRIPALRLNSRVLHDDQLDLCNAGLALARPRKCGAHTPQPGKPLV